MSLQGRLCHSSITSVGYLNKTIWNLRNLCNAIFSPTQIRDKILCMFLLKILNNRKPVTLYVKSRILAVINLNI